MEQSNIEGAIPPSTSTKGLSLKGIIQVLYKPAAFFEQLKDNPKILVPYLFLAVITTVLLFSISDLIVKMQMESPQFEKQMLGQPVTPQIKQMIKMNIIIFGSITMLLAPLVAAALGSFVGNFVMAGKARFKQILSIMLYGELLYVLGSLVLVPMMLAKGTIMVSISLGVLAASQGPESILYLALSKIGLFYIWEWIVVGIGLSILYNISRNKGFVISVLSVGMLSIFHVIFTAIMKMIF